MGTSQSRGSEPITQPESFLHYDETALKLASSDRYSSDALSTYSIFSRDSKTQSLKADIQRKIRENKLGAKEDRALGVVMGLAVGDALGAPLEFSAVQYDSTELQSFDQKDLWAQQDYNRFRLKPGQWTDDASMSFCLADSLIINQGFNPRDLRLRFNAWWRCYLYFLSLFFILIPTLFWFGLVLSF